MEYQNINENKNQKKEHDFRNIALTIVGLFVILAAVSGGTFAYYSFTTINNTVVTGTAATASLNLTVTKVSPSTTSPLVPQLNAGVAAAAKAACKDGNNNNVCQVYSIKIENKSTANAKIKATISFKWPGGSYQNLKWKTISANPTSAATTPTYGSMTSGIISPSSPTSEEQNYMLIDNNISLAPEASTTKYIVVWINETGADQNETDKGTFTGIITVTGADGQGLTSTFTG